MILPFYIYYNSISKKKVKINSGIGSIFITSLIFFLLIKIFLVSIVNPIQVGFPQNEGVTGVDIYTMPVTSNLNLVEISFELLFSTIIFLLLSFLFIKRYENFKIILEKIIYFSVLIFFVIYISIFYIQLGSMFLQY